MNTPTVFMPPVFTGKLYGVELELEAPGLYEVEEVWDEAGEEPIDHREPDLPAGWAHREEDSVNGPEVVFNKPVDFATSVELLKNLFKDVERQGFNPQRTPRGSTHFHVNVSDLTWKQLREFVMVCAWAEPFLCRIAGSGRMGNLFAQSYATSPSGWLGIIRSLQENTFCFWEDTHYSAINFSAVPRLGSVEFRMAPSCRNVNDAVYWLELINSVATCGRGSSVSVTGSNPPDCITRLAAELPDYVAKRVMGVARKQAQEIWWRINNPVKPDLTEQASVQSPSFDEYDGFNSFSGVSLEEFIATFPLVTPPPQF